MSGFLVDTNVISEFAKQQPDAQVVRWVKAAHPNSLYVSVITFGELRLGIEDLPPGRRRADLESWLQSGLPSWLAGNLVPVTRNVAGRWGELTIRAKRNGMMLTTADGLIAATAIEHNLTLVTRNVKDFNGLALPILNPWD